MESVKDRLARLRQNMQAENVQALIIPTSDYHDSEYVCDHFAARKYFSGFTGSAGTLAVLPDQAALWTDGRYFIQAGEELKDSGVQLMKMGEEDTPAIHEWILENLPEGSTVAFDGRCITDDDYNTYRRHFALGNLNLKADTDLIDKSWIGRPDLPATRTFVYPVEYAGQSVAEKLADVRKQMKEAGAASHVITRIDEIIWLGNFRADDIPCFPAALAYMTVSEDDAVLYINEERVDEKTRQQLNEAGIRLAAYDQIYEDVKHLSVPVLADPAITNARLIESMDDVVKAPDPILLLKARKNATELERTREAHRKDGAAVTKFMYWLKNLPENSGETEVSAADRLREERRKQPEYFEDSFETISAYKENAALMHYHPGKKDVLLHKEGMLLVDSGGQYMDGTTDITRTFVLGPVSDEEKYWFTKALQGHIRLQMARFLQGCRGINLDILARGPLWDEQMDYQCGTGHGVGHVSTVHESPNGIRWRIIPERNDSAVLEPGMLQSNEPGVYMEGKFGIRHENEIVVQKAGKNKYGQFLEFENLTFVPFDRDGIIPDLLNDRELDWLNDYHRQVVEKIGPRLNDEEREWLKEVCRPITK